MEPVLFYGVPQGCSFGSIVALEWLGQPYRLCRIEMPADMQGEAYARVNPVRETPVLLLEDGRRLSESVAILQQLAWRGLDRGLGFGQGSAEADRLTQMLAFLNTTFFSAFSPLWRAYEMAENPPVQSVLRQIGREDVAKAHGHLDRLLEGRSWLAGEQRTVADAYFAGIARWADYHRAVDPAAYPNVQRLRRRLEDDPAVRFAQAIEAGEPARSAGRFLGEVSFAELEGRLAA